MNFSFHTPVMLNEVLSFLITRVDGVYVDGTIGGGGHSAEILERTSGKLIGFDLDPEAVKFSTERLKKFKDRIVIFNDNYVNIKKRLNEIGVEKITGFLLDLGISSYQLDFGGGFSFRGDERLDMRMNRESGITAEEILNLYSEKELAEIFIKYGEERKAKAIARAIVSFRRRKRIETTGELVKIVDKVVSKKFRLKTLARIFQALRIAVNNELENLKLGLENAFDVLERGGRIVVISYHSLEDRIVKNFFKSDKIKVLTKKPLTPSEEEIKLNPRARSAKLRAGEKILD